MNHSKINLSVVEQYFVSSHMVAIYLIRERTVPQGFLMGWVHAALDVTETLVAVTTIMNDEGSKVVQVIMVQFFYQPIWSNVSLALDY